MNHILLVLNRFVQYIWCSIISWTERKEWRKYLKQSLDNEVNNFLLFWVFYQYTTIFALSLKIVAIKNWLCTISFIYIHSRMTVMAFESLTMIVISRFTKIIVELQLLATEQLKNGITTNANNSGQLHQKKLYSLINWRAR